MDKKKPAEYFSDAYNIAYNAALEDILNSLPEERINSEFEHQTEYGRIIGWNDCLKLVHERIEALKK